MAEGIWRATLKGHSRHLGLLLKGHAGRLGVEERVEHRLLLEVLDRGRVSRGVEHGRLRLLDRVEEVGEGSGR